MKPLELNIHRRSTHGNYYDRRNDRVVSSPEVEGMAFGKRFLDAELAAEWWSAEATVRDIYTQSARNPYRREDAWKVKHQRRNTLHRFATTPSYDATGAAR